MPLSEHEERVLAEIEAQLEEDDPGLMARARRAASGHPGRRLRLAVGGFVLGLVSLLALTFHFAFGVLGIGLMLVSVVVGATVLQTQGSEVVRRLRRRLDDAFDGDTFSGEDRRR